MYNYKKFELSNLKLNPLFMSHLDEIFISPQSTSTNQDNMENQVKQTEMVEKVPSYDPDDSAVHTPEPSQPTSHDDKDERTEVLYNETSKENVNNKSLSPKSAAIYDNLENEEEKDSLYDVLAPKQSIGSQMNEVVDNIPNQNNIVIIDENGDESQPLSYDPKKMDYGNAHLDLKSTLKKDQRAWIDPWEAAVQDHFIIKKLKI